MTRAVATGWRLIAASATPALSMTRQATISATLGAGGGAAAATSAIFHVNCACFGNCAELGCTRTSCTTMSLSFLPSDPRAADRVLSERLASCPILPHFLIRRFGHLRFLETDQDKKLLHI